MHNYLIIVFLSMPLAACAADSPMKSEAVPMDGDAKQVVCTEPRPQICTMEYNPVCAVQKDGSTKTYSSGCNACSDATVVSYKPGAC